MEVITKAPIYVEGNESFSYVDDKKKKKKDKKTGDKIVKGLQNVKESDLGKFFIASGGQYLVDKYGQNAYNPNATSDDAGTGNSQLPPVGDQGGDTKSMTTGAKVAIGVTVAVVLGVVIYFATKKKS